MSESNASVRENSTLALAVRLGESLHAIPVGAVEEVLPALPIEPIPHAPPFIRGVLFVRGHLIPVVDAGERLGMPRQPPLEPPIVCLVSAGRLIGVEVDEAIDLVDLASSTQLSAELAGAKAGFFSGVVDLEGVIYHLLDPERLFAPLEKSQLEAAESQHLLSQARQ